MVIMTASKMVNEAEMMATDEERAQFKEMVKMHQAMFAKIANLVYRDEPHWLQLIDTVTHDDSKLWEPELSAYALKFVRKMENPPGWKEAVEHHYLVNPHHPEHWSDFTDRGYMPMHHLRESVIDMAAWHAQHTLNRFPVVPIMPEYFDFDYRFFRRYNEVDRVIAEHERDRLRHIVAKPQHTRWMRVADIGF